MRPRCARDAPETRPRRARERRTAETCTAAKRRRDGPRGVRQVPILSTLTQYERMTIADALVPSSFADADEIIREGDVNGDTFYIVAAGEVECTTGAPGEPQVVIGRCGVGDYFGEMALLTSRPRACTVRAIGDVKTLELDRKTFRRVMGPLQEILKRNMGAYSQYIMG